MYSIMLPIHLNEDRKPENVLSVVREAKAEYVVLAFDDIILSAEREGYERTLSIVRDYVPFLQGHGYKVGIWFWSLWLGDIPHDELIGEVMLRSSGEPRIAETALNSHEKRLSGFLCPTSHKIEIMLDIIRYAASFQPDFILLNDDFGYSTYLGGIGCYCDRHMAKIRERLGYDISREQLKAAIFSGGKNRVRDEWLRVQGASMEDYARRVRMTIDEVNPAIRCGFCCVMSNWSADGVSVEGIAKLMAGNTRPLIRLIGAPYWATGQAWGNRLQHTVELERMECAFIEDKSIELISEGDVYPRPRYRVPASFLEIYDTALRAAGCTSGIFKLMLDYASSFSYERGYLDRHIRNSALYDEIERIFGDKCAVGVRVHERMNKVADADFDGVENPEQYAKDMFFSYGARLLSDNSIPTVYEGEGVGIAFGENARYLPDTALSGGLVLDIRAARILMEQGVDVGIESIGDAIDSNYLYFPEDGERTLAHYGEGIAYEIRPKKSARVVTDSLSGDKRYADAIEYENAEGQKFVVYAFDAALVDENRYRNYGMQRQLLSSLAWLGAKLPAVCAGNPDLYMICKENEKGLAIGLWNISADEIIEPCITLSETYGTAEFIHCDGVMEGACMRLSPIPAYGFAFVHLKH